MSNSNMEVDTSSIQVVEEFPGFLRLYSDGSVWRSNVPGKDMPVHDDGSVVWKDVVFDTKNNLSLRLYKPAPSPLVAPKLPIFYYFHGGGFCFGTRAWPNYHNYCLKLASELQAVVISADYRLAPENRLPAAIEDGYAAIKWLQSEATNVGESDYAWIKEVVDLNRVYIFGDSSGGNITHHLAVRLGPGSAELAPVRVRGYIFLTPFFGGTILTKSEIEGPKDVLINLEVIERFWRLAIPVGETSDDPIVNPFGPNSTNLEETDLDPIFVVVAGSDLLKDRVEHYANNLIKWGKKIKYMEFQGQEHGFYLSYPDSEPSTKLMLDIKKFVHDNSGSCSRN